LILEPEQKIPYTQLTDREKVKFKKQLLIYLFFLVISIILWYLIALSKDYTTTLAYPVKYEDFPRGKVLVSDLPEKLNLRVKGLGFSILQHKITSYLNNITLPINIFKLNIIQKDNQFKYYILTRSTKEWIGNQLGNDIQLFDINPDTLFFEFTDVVDKKIRVKPRINLQLKKQYMIIGDIKIKPDSIIASGPQSMIDTLQYVYTEEMKNKDVEDSLVKELSLVPIKRFLFQTQKVLVIVPVEKYTEMLFNVPIEAENAPFGLDIKTFPGTITLSCRVGISAYDKLTPYMFRATVDYNALTSNPQSKLKVNLVKIPSNVQNVRFYPKSVDYLIEK
jgi:hypothetical protein